jgi:hypothetical protein
MAIIVHLTEHEAKGMEAYTTLVATTAREAVVAARMRHCTRRQRRGRQR